MFLYLFENDGVKYMATAMSKVHPKSVFTFKNARYEDFDVHVGDAKKVYQINSFKQLGYKRKALEKNWGMKTFLVESKSERLTLYKLMIWICGELFFHAEVHHVDTEGQKEEPVRIWSLKTMDDVKEAVSFFGLPEEVINKNLSDLFCKS